MDFEAPLKGVWRLRPEHAEHRLAGCLELGVDRAPVLRDPGGGTRAGIALSAEPAARAAHGSEWRPSSRRFDTRRAGLRTAL
jgi:hypothetical protein